MLSRENGNLPVPILADRHRRKPRRVVIRPDRGAALPMMSRLVAAQ
jgi:hypothetical protein